MNDLEDLLRTRLSSLSEPQLEPQPDLASRVRRVHRRRRLVPLTVAAGVVVASTAFVLIKPGHSQATLTVVPLASPTAASEQCDVDARLRAAGGLNPIVHFAWPSGAHLVLLQTPGGQTPVTAMLSTPTVDPQDRAAAEARWGCAVVVLPFDASSVARLPEGSAPSAEAR